MTASSHHSKSRESTISCQALPQTHATAFRKPSKNAAMHPAGQLVPTCIPNPKIRQKSCRSKTSLGPRSALVTGLLTQRQMMLAPESGISLSLIVSGKPLPWQPTTSSLFTTQDARSCPSSVEKTKSSSTVSSPLRTGCQHGQDSASLRMKLNNYPPLETSAL